MQCPYCNQELELEDTFGNTDYCLDVIGYHTDYYIHRNPIKYGDIYRCNNEECKSEAFNYYFYTLDDESFYELHEGYPC